MSRGIRLEWIKGMTENEKRLTPLVTLLMFGIAGSLFDAPQPISSNSGI